MAMDIRLLGALSGVTEGVERMTSKMGQYQMASEKWKLDKKVKDAQLKKLEFDLQAEKRKLAQQDNFNKLLESLMRGRDIGRREAGEIPTVSGPGGVPITGGPGSEYGAYEDVTMRPAGGEVPFAAQKAGGFQELEPEVSITPEGGRVTLKRAGKYQPRTREEALEFEREKVEIEKGKKEKPILAEYRKALIEDRQIQMEWGASPGEIVPFMPFEEYKRLTTPREVEEEVTLPPEIKTTSEARKWLMKNQDMTEEEAINWIRSQ